MTHRRPLTRTFTVTCPICQAPRLLTPGQLWASYIPVELLCCGPAHAAEHTARVLAAYQEHFGEMDEALEDFVRESGFLCDQVAEAVCE